MISFMAQTPLNIYRTLPANTAENKRLLLFLVIVRAENPRPNKRAGFSSSKHHRSLFSPLFLLFTCCSLCSANNVLFKPGQKTLSVFSA